jgi:cell division protein FtsI (penicillin-binding protein 3)
VNVAGRSKGRRLGLSDARLLAVGGLLLFAWLGAGARLFYVQVVESDRWAAESLEQRLTRKELAARRGTIFDTRGREMAVTIDGTTIYANPKQIESAEVAARLLGAVLDRPTSVILERLREDSTFVYLARQLEFDQAEEVRALDLAGIYTLSEPKRVYPAGALASHILGWVDIDNQGKEGLEYRFDEVLRGSPGAAIVETDPSGRIIPQGRYQVEPADPGDDLVTTIDLDVQFAAERACSEILTDAEAQRCTAVVLDPEDGAVVALTTLPDFDPNDREGVGDEVLFGNFAIRGTFEPGSTLKTMTIAAALEDGLVKPSSVIPDVPARYEVVEGACESRTDDLFGCFGDPEYHVPEDMTVEEIVTRSSNVGTILVGERVGTARLRRFLERFGLGQPTGIEYAGEAAGSVNVDPTCGSCTASASIGYSVSVSPLQMAAAYGAIANDGMWVEPHLVDQVVSGDEAPTTVHPGRHRVVSPATARTMRHMLQLVVEKGTGLRAAIPGYAVAGKTGTSEQLEDTGYNRRVNVASFVGMAPADDPALVVAVVVEGPSYAFRSGGLSAAPVFAEVMEKALHHLGVPSDGG